jgi:lipoprotein-anchoring transpeptidase ErfK/SrfK
VRRVTPLLLAAAIAGCGGGTGGEPVGSTGDTAAGSAAAGTSTNSAAAVPTERSSPAGTSTGSSVSSRAAQGGSDAASSEPGTAAGSTAAFADDDAAGSAPAREAAAPAGGAAATAGAATASGADPVAVALAAGRFPTAEVLRRSRLRTAPGGRALARIGPRTEFGSPSVLSVIRRRGAWLAVHAAQLPNGRAGWLPAAAVRLGAVDVSVHVDRSARRLTVRRGDRVLRRFTVAVGRPGNVTPTGRFAITDKLIMPAGGPYGCCAVALTGHQLHLPSGWAGGDRLAIHGTNAPWSIGQAASLGCMRAATADIRWLLRRMPLGAPVFIRA